MEKTLTAEQAVQLIKAAKGTGMYMPNVLALGLGLRKGEIYGLMYSDTDFFTKQVYIERQLGKDCKLEKE